MKNRFIHYNLFLFILLPFCSCLGTNTDDMESIQVEGLKKRGKGTPAAFIVNQLDKPKRLERLLLGKSDPTNSKNQQMSRDSLLKVKELVELGINWDLPNPKIKIPFSKTKVTIDGNIDDSEWQNAYISEGCYPLNTKKKSDTVQGTWKLMWDNDYLYVGVTFPDTNIIAPKAERDKGNPYRYDALEIFIMTKQHPNLYWEIVVNPSGTIFDSLQHAQQCGIWVPKRSKNMLGIKFASSVQGTVNKFDDQDQSYTLELALPFAEMPGYTKEHQPNVGQTIRMNIIRSEKTSINKNRIFYSFQPLLYNGHNIDGMTHAAFSKADNLQANSLKQ